MAARGRVLAERYEILAEIGQGGMSSVYLARDRNLGSYWAIKAMRNDGSLELQNFKREVEMLAGLGHWAIPRIVDRIEQASEYFVVMDFIDGVSLGKKLISEGPQAEKDIVEWGKALCDVLNYLHREALSYPIIYCDIKPDNLMLNQAGQLQLVDFGTVHLAKTDAIESKGSWGTRGFAAPEQYKGSQQPITARTDIYALGVTLFNLATGQIPGPPPQAVPYLRRINPAYSEGLAYIIQKCTQDDPDKRYQTALELQDDLKHISELNTGYRQKMKKRLLAFSLSLFLSLLGFVSMILAYNGLKADYQVQFQDAFKTASSLAQAGEKEGAANAFLQAIQNRPDDFDAHLRYFQMLLPDEKSKDAIGQTKLAIDEMRKRFLDNPQSPMHKNVFLKMLVVRQCMNVNDPNYAAYALTYLEEVRQSEAYKNNSIEQSEVDAYLLLAEQGANTMETRNFAALGEALLSLQKLSDEKPMLAARRLNYYYIIMQMYSTYPNQLPNAYEDLYELGLKSKALIESEQNEAFIAEDQANQELSFNQVVPLYKMVLSGLYNQGALTEDSEKKLVAMSRSLEWYGYLEDLGVDLDLSLWLKKGHAEKAIALSLEEGATWPADEKNEPWRKMSSQQWRAEAEKSYRAAIALDAKHLLAQLSLTQALLDKEILFPKEQRNMDEVMKEYAVLLQIEKEQGTLSNVELSQLSALKNQLKVLGLV